MWKISYREKAEGRDARREGCRSPGWQGAQVRLEKEEISLGGDKGKGL